MRATRREKAKGEWQNRYCLHARKFLSSSIMKGFLAAFLLGSFAFAAAPTFRSALKRDGPTRKLGRGISNVLYGMSELPSTSRENQS